MKVYIDGCEVELVQGDITEQETEAIVNAANEELIPGGGVDGAIHRKGGPSILEEIRSKYKRCPTGEAVITKGGNLKAKYVIHTVGPIYKDGKSGEPELLKKAYQSALKLALDYGLNSVAFPALSTGAYGYPIKEAAEIALKTVCDFLKKHKAPQKIVFVLWKEEHFQIFAETLKSLISSKGV
ncbi:macro domain-containing protein [Thermodesulfobacterium commune]|jgi:O-acetyl-ADP-ribose deacetylase (regulator of RNase III)|uniref:Appr-1-p processing protein n=2 Tax=Thermodesulfobacterium commune TaxID=1741 RepID=A0A075WR66_9BACT|nr:macro domain-containing protein [Thermodesulfobacterium commune]MDK2861958.1 O-acetyl-ADP-ribose deacetylase [Thermodesulfobacterium sp.]AIH03804.1 Appr-1-p processing protein [Thermodesulfobacterium commune DSM 2178]HAA83947.1 macro domain-containing protein [Thermodesulfobacterium commune]HBT04061.1 macro domain-containing protein [Thermodesulfobacterium commune]HCP09582.1 macro domain-containing protein [Thermodesulfobacterium commune]